LASASSACMTAFIIFFFIFFCVFFDIIEAPDLPPST
jgi:hypothetical protein